MDNEKITALLKMGYFPVTDDFWAAADMPLYIGDGFDWAFRMPLNANQPFMPYHTSTLEQRLIEECRLAADRNLLEK